LLYLLIDLLRPTLTVIITAICGPGVWLRNPAMTLLSC
jgi:hypothetical protein